MKKHLKYLILLLLVLSPASQEGSFYNQLRPQSLQEVSLNYNYASYDQYKVDLQQIRNQEFSKNSHGKNFQNVSSNFDTICDRLLVLQLHIFKSIKSSLTNQLFLTSEVSSITLE